MSQWLQRNHFCSRIKGVQTRKGLRAFFGISESTLFIFYCGSYVIISKIMVIENIAKVRIIIADTDSKINH